MDRKPVLIAACAIGLLWAVAWFDRSAGSRGVAARSERVASPLVVASAATGKTPRARAAAAPAPTRDAERRDAVVDPLSPEGIEQERKAFTDYYGRLDAKRATESIDREWEQEVRQQVATLMRADGPLQHSKLVSLECGSTLCRIEAEHDNARAKWLYTQRFMLDISTLLPEATLFTQPDSLKTVAHFARQGASLPRMSREDLEAMGGVASTP
jgi:hypothetical protein